VSNLGNKTDGGTLGTGSPSSAYTIMNFFTIPLLLTIPALVSAFSLNPFSRRGASSLGYYNPDDSGGSLLTYIPGSNTVGVGEPLNVILSGNSDQAILVDQEINGGLRNYFLSFGFSSECLGQHSGTPQQTNLGDGNGFKNETAVIRWNYGDPSLGTCRETIEGGSHFRYWTQNGPSKNSGGIFMAFSYEMPIAEQHDIVINGYNLGRDWGVGNVTNQTSIIDTATVSNTSTFSGQTQAGGYVYSTSVQYVSGLLSNTSNGINHGSTVGVNGSNAIDGLVAVWQVKIVQKPPKSSALRISTQWTGQIPLITALVALSSHLFSS